MYSLKNIHTSRVALLSELIKGQKNVGFFVKIIFTFIKQM